MANELAKFAVSVFKYCLLPSLGCVLLGFAVYWFEGWPIDYFDIFGSAFGVFIYTLLLACLIHLQMLKFNWRKRK